MASSSTPHEHITSDHHPQPGPVEEAQADSTIHENNNETHNENQNENSNENNDQNRDENHSGSQNDNNDEIHVENQHGDNNENNNENRDENNNKNAYPCTRSYRLIGVHLCGHHRLLLANEINPISDRVSHVVETYGAPMRNRKSATPALDENVPLDDGKPIYCARCPTCEDRAKSLSQKEERRFQQSEFCCLPRSADCPELPSVQAFATVLRKRGHFLKPSLREGAPMGSFPKAEWNDCCPELKLLTEKVVNCILVGFIPDDEGLEASCLLKQASGVSISEDEASTRKSLFKFKSRPCLSSHDPNTSSKLRLRLEIYPDALIDQPSEPDESVPAATSGDHARHRFYHALGAHVSHVENTGRRPYTGLPSYNPRRTPQPSSRLGADEWISRTEPLAESSNNPPAQEEANPASTEEPADTESETRHGGTRRLRQSISTSFCRMINTFRHRRSSRSSDSPPPPDSAPNPNGSERSIPVAENYSQTHTQNQTQDQTQIHAQNHTQDQTQDHAQNSAQNHAQNHAHSHTQNHAQNHGGSTVRSRFSSLFPSSMGSRYESRSRSTLWLDRVALAPSSNEPPVSENQSLTYSDSQVLEGVPPSNELTSSDNQVLNDSENGALEILPPSDEVTASDNQISNDSNNQVFEEPAMGWVNPASPDFEQEATQRNGEILRPTDTVSSDSSSCQRTGSSKYARTTVEEHGSPENESSTSSRARADQAFNDTNGIIHAGDPAAQQIPEPNILSTSCPSRVQSISGLEYLRHDFEQKVIRERTMFQAGRLRRVVSEHTLRSQANTVQNGHGNARRIGSMNTRPDDDWGLPDPATHNELLNHWCLQMDVMEELFGNPEEEARAQEMDG